MIRTVFSISALRLWNSPQELLLTFVVPIVFFSIFALIFSRGVGVDTPSISLIVLDDDRTPLTETAARLLKRQSAIELKTRIRRDSERVSLNDLAAYLIRQQGADVVAHFPAGLQATVEQGQVPRITLLLEGADPIAKQMVRAALTQVLATAAAEQMQGTRRQLKVNPSNGGRPLPQPIPRKPAAAAAESSALISTPSVADGSTDDKRVDRAVLVNQVPGPPEFNFAFRNVFASNKHNPRIAMYAAGIAVMFLLFSASGAGGSLLEEQEAGTLDRLLNSRLTLTQLLCGKWLYISALGCTQLSIMFLWAQIAFNVDLFRHLPGFLVMTLATAAATASLAICLAVFCRTRAQLHGVSIIVILTMSALGGSMVPRYVMSEEMQRVGKITFNAWALDGFQKVFWYDLSVSSLSVEVGVLCGIAALLAVLARVLAVRWAVN